MRLVSDVNKLAKIETKVSRIPAKPFTTVPSRVPIVTRIGDGRATAKTKLNNDVSFNTFQWKLYLVVSFHNKC